MNKKMVFEAMLEKGDSVLVQLDPRVQGVVLPKHLRKELVTMLQIGYALPVPIDDLQIDHEGFRATLTFSRSPFFCDVPWRAVSGFRSDAVVIVFNEDIERLHQEQPVAAPPVGRPVAPFGKAAHLRVVEGGRG